LSRARDGALRDILHVISVTTLASLLTGFNARLAVVGLPNVASALGADVMQVFWISQGYMLGSTAIQLIVGRLADLYGRVRIFNLGFLVFTFGALTAGLASNPYQVIVARVIQGVGGGILMSLSTAILADHVPFLPRCSSQSFYVFSWSHLGSSTSPTGIWESLWVHGWLSSPTARGSHLH